MSRAVSRIPTSQIKCLLQKSKKVVIKNMSEKLFHSHESFMYTYGKKAVLIISWAVNFVEYVIINIDQLLRKQGSNLSKKYCSVPKTTKAVVAFCTNKNPKTQKVSCLCLYWWTWFEEIEVLFCTNTMGCIAHLLKSLSGDVKKNAGPFTQISKAIIVHLIRRTRMLHVPNKSIQFHNWNPDYLNLVEFQSMYWEMETVFSVRYFAS